MNRKKSKNESLEQKLLTDFSVGGFLLKSTIIGKISLVFSVKILYT